MANLLTLEEQLRLQTYIAKGVEILDSQEIDDLRTMLAEWLEREVSPSDEVSHTQSAVKRLLGPSANWSRMLRGLMRLVAFVRAVLRLLGQGSGGGNPGSGGKSKTPRF